MAILTTPPIVVGYDGSELADLALTWAAESAVGSDVNLEVIVAMKQYTHGEWYHDEYHAAMQAAVERALARLSELGVVGAKVEKLETSPVDALCDAGEHASMVVVGAKGHGAWESALIGSTSRHLATYAPCTVVVVRPSTGPDPRIVVGIDSGPSSAAALDFALARAERLHAPVEAVHGWKPDRLLRHDPQTGLVPERDFEEMQRLLAEVTAGPRADHPDVELTTEPISVPPAQVLCDASKSASLVVVGSRGRSAIARVLLGSVSEHVLEHAECSVAVVR